MKKLFIFCIFFTFISYAQERTRTIEGFVYLDKNENNQLDKNEKGIRNVYLSDGRSLFKTNKAGKYKAEVKGNRSLFLVTPSGYQTFGNKWYYHKPKKLSKKEVGVNFALKKKEVTGKFRFLAIGDIQVGSDEEMKMAANTILNELADRRDYDFSLYLGDLVNDKPSLFFPLKELVENVGRPYKTVYGNHDRNFKQTLDNQDSSYKENYGPTTYAFFHEDVLFIVLNSIFPVGKYGYKGEYTKDQFEFVKNILKLAKKDQLIVLNQHIHLDGMSNKDQLLKLLNIKNEMLFLTAHTHSVRRKFHKRPGLSAIQELTAGTTSGNWWTGQRNYQGIPLALMKDGSPRGYFEIEIDKNNYKFTYKGVQQPPNYQFNTWFGDLESNEVPLTIDSEHNQFILNVFAGSAKTDVEVFINGISYGMMDKGHRMDPFIKRIKRLQKEKLYPNLWSKRAPYLSTPSSHIWVKNLPFEKLKKRNKMRIEIKDPYLGDISQEFFFWKE